MKFSARAYQLQQRFVEILLDHNHENGLDAPGLLKCASILTRGLMAQEDAQIAETAKEVAAEQKLLQKKCEHVFEFPSLSPDRSQTAQSIVGRPCKNGCGFVITEAMIPLSTKKKHAHKWIGQGVKVNGIGGTFTGFKCGCRATVKLTGPAKQ